MRKEDQATGEIAGKVVPRGAKEPLFLRREKLGSSPCDIILSVMVGSSPSSPMMIKRLTLPRAWTFFLRMALKRNRKGHEIREKKAIMKVRKSTKKEVRKAKPAPGPI